MRKLALVVDMHGCPNRCKHCWLGHIDHSRMSDNADEFIVNYFKPFFEQITFYSWLREPDFADNYEEQWERDKELSIGAMPERFELASFYRLCRDANYVHFLKKVGVKEVQLTFFGMEEMTDKYVGRKGAFKELVISANILIDNGIIPRYQVFINAENKNDIVRLVEYLKQNHIIKKCDDIGIPFKLFIHQGSCDGENRKLYNIRISKKDVPKELIEYYLAYDKLYSEKECCELLMNDTTHHVYHNEDLIVLNITSDFSVYYNFTNISDNWKIGNMKEETAEHLVDKIISENTFALNKAREITLGDLVKLYGNFQSERAFFLDDYKGYLLNNYVESLVR